MGAVLVVVGAVLLTPVARGRCIGSVLFPLFAIAVGAIVAWSNLDDAQRSGGSGRGIRAGQPLRLAAGGVGVGLAVAGILVLVTRGQSLTAVWDALLAAIAVLVGAADHRRALGAAAVGRPAPRAGRRGRATERADIAAHLHDSVLQTLALIQRQRRRRRRRHPPRPRPGARAAVVAVCRAARVAVRRLAAAVTEVAHDVEDVHGVPIDLVVTGDRRYEPHGAALTQAMREALLNAVRHGGTPVRPTSRSGRPGSRRSCATAATGSTSTPCRPTGSGCASRSSGGWSGTGGRPRVRRREDGTEVELRLPPIEGDHAMSQRRPPSGAAQPGPVRVVLVDDHRMFRTGVRAELTEAMTAAVSRCEFVGEAPDVDTAIAVIRAERPDVVLLDVHLPGGVGQRRGRRHPRLLGVDDRGRGAGALPRPVGLGRRRGRHRRHPRRRPRLRHEDDRARDLITAIRRVADGDAVFSPRLAGFVLDAFGAAAGEIAEVDEELDRLSAREREVMRLIARGYQYKEVAKELFISVKTVETHVSSVLRKLQLSSRHELTAWAMGRRLL